MTAAHVTAAPAVRGRSVVPSTPSVQSRALAHLLMNSLRRFGDFARVHNPVHRRLARELFNLVGHVPPARGTRTHPIAEAGVHGEWIAARGADEGAGAILYLHGGGFVFGGRRTHRHLVAAISAASGLPALLLDYRHAPEHPFPAAADDAIAGFSWLMDQGFAADRIVVAGDSAGGHLTAGLLADLHRRRMPMPAAAVLLSPFLDLTAEGLARADAARRDPFVVPERARECGLAYAGEFAFTHRRLDVLRGNKRRWPPVLIQVGDTECLLGDSERLAEAVNAAGGHCELQVWPGQVHVFPAFFPVIPEARAALRYAGSFLRAAVSEPVAVTA